MEATAVFVAHAALKMRAPSMCSDRFASFAAEATKERSSIGQTRPPEALLVFSIVTAVAGA